MGLPGREGERVRASGRGGRMVAGGGSGVGQRRAVGERGDLDGGVGTSIVGKGG